MAPLDLDLDALVELLVRCRDPIHDDQALRLRLVCHSRTIFCRRLGLPRPRDPEDRRQHQSVPQNHRFVLLSVRPGWPRSRLGRPPIERRERPCEQLPRELGHAPPLRQERSSPRTGIAPDPRQALAVHRDDRLVPASASRRGLPPSASRPSISGICNVHQDEIEGLAQEGVTATRPFSATSTECPARSRRRVASFWFTRLSSTSRMWRARRAGTAVLLWTVPDEASAAGSVTTKRPMARRSSEGMMGLARHALTPAVVARATSPRRGSDVSRMIRAPWCAPRRTMSSATLMLRGPACDRPHDESNARLGACRVTRRRCPPCIHPCRLHAHLRAARQQPAVHRRSAATRTRARQSLGRGGIVRGGVSMPCGGHDDVECAAPAARLVVPIRPPMRPTSGPVGSPDLPPNLRVVDRRPGRRARDRRDLWQGSRCRVGHDS